MTDLGPATSLLIGWSQISSYTHKSQEQLRRYRKNFAFPAPRWGKRVVSSPALIDQWLLEYMRIQRQMGKL
jgi:hypothetical protein